MKNTQLLILILILVFSCKKNADNSNEKHQKIVKSGIEIDSTIKKDTIFNSDLEFFNNLDVLGIGLIKVNNQDSLAIIKNNKELIENVYNPTIIPIFFKPDYGIFYLVCLSEEENNYKVQIDKDNTVLLSKKENVKFLSWSDFLLNTTGVSNLDWKKNPFKEEPDTKTTSLRINEEDDFTVVRVHNEWIQISNDGGSSIGWIKWKEGNKLLIEIYLLI